jgi:rod shape determining protein RodA
MAGVVCLFIIGIALFINKLLFDYNKIYILGVGIVLSLIVLTYPAYVKRIKHFRIISVMLILTMAYTFSIEYIFNNVLEKHQRTRINVVLGLESDPKGVEYNVNQSKIAIGSGEFIGKGFLQGTQTKFDFVPEQDTDFIFCTVGEEWGFLGSSFVLILFTTLLVRIVMIAERQRSKMNRIYGYCVASILFFHVAVNVGMTIGLTPVIGIPLPFFSYGGSSLWSFTILLFILLRLDTSRMDKF